jgi:hypothetical protein
MIPAPLLITPPSFQGIDLWRGFDYTHEHPPRARQPLHPLLISPLPRGRLRGGTQTWGYHLHLVQAAAKE